MTDTREFSVVLPLELTAVQARALYEETAASDPELLALVGNILKAVEVAARSERTALCLEEFGFRYKGTTRLQDKAIKRLTKLGYKCIPASYEPCDESDGGVTSRPSATTQYWLRW